MRRSSSGSGSPSDYEFDDWDCGYEMHVEGVESHKIQLRTDKKLDGNVFFTDNYSCGKPGRRPTDGGSGCRPTASSRTSRPSRSAAPCTSSPSTKSVSRSSSRTRPGRVVSRDRGNITGHFTIDFADGSNTFEFQAQGTAPDVRCRPVQGRRTAAPRQRRLGPLPDATADRLDRLPDGLLRIPAAELHRDRREEPAAPVLQRLRRERRRTAEALSKLLFAGIPRYINVGGWPTDRRSSCSPPSMSRRRRASTSRRATANRGAGHATCRSSTTSTTRRPAFCTTPDEVHDFIAYAVAHYNVDPTRVYVTGLSCGAYGVWEYLAKYHDDLRWRRLSRSPATDGRRRPVVLRSRLDAALGVPRRARRHRRSARKHRADDRPCGCPGVPADEAKLTVYPDRDHNSWDPAYGGANGDDIYAWMLGFSNP